MNTLRKTAPFNNLFAAQRGQRDWPTFSFLADRLPMAILLIAPGTGFVRYANQRAVELLACTRPELENLSLAELITDANASEIIERIHRLSSDQQPTIENVHLATRAGESVTVDLQSVAHWSEAATDAILIIAHDAQPRLQQLRARANRQQSIAALRDLTRAQTQYLTEVAEIDLEAVLTACQNLMLADCIGLYQHTRIPLGYQLRFGRGPAADFPNLLTLQEAAFTTSLSWRSGERPATLLARSARNARLAALYTQSVGPGPTPAALLVVGYRAPGPPAGLSEQLQIAADFIAAAQALIDLQSQHRSARRQAEEAATLYTSLAAEISEGLVGLSADGHILTLNPALESLLGFQAADVIGLPLEAVLISSRPIAEEAQRALQTNARWDGGEADLIRRDGQMVSVAIRLAPLPAGGGLLLLTDHTDQRELQAQHEKLRHRAALGELAAMFAHDVRNPLNGLTIGLDLFTSKLPSDPFWQGAIEKMRVEIARIEQLVKNMLTYAKADKPDYKPIHLQPMLERILTRWKNRFTRLNIQLIVELDPHTPPALADQFQLERVFNNFIGNACDTIAGKTTADDSQPVIAVRCGPATHPKTPPGQYVEVVFTDTGAGIPAEIKGHIFDSFVTTKADGTGLGLAISKNILTAHRGAIHVDTHPNIGTSFHIFIPIANSRS